MCIRDRQSTWERERVFLFIGGNNKMSNSRPLIPDCVDVSDAVEILDIYHNGNEKKAVEMVREHLNFCAACFKQFHSVNVIEEIVTGKKADDVYLKFIKVVDKVNQDKELEAYKLEEIYIDFLSGKCSCAIEEERVEELNIANDFYDKLNELIEDENNAQNHSKSHFFAWGAVAAVVGISILSIGFMNTSRFGSGTSALKSVKFPTYGEQTAYTPTSYSNKENLNSALKARFGLPVDRELENVYSHPTSEDNKILVAVRMDYQTQQVWSETIENKIEQDPILNHPEVHSIGSGIAGTGEGHREVDRR
eukprot:TRINITY_DN35229_c0_g1_i2.p1 TRINITY_DN35229_c0_g1~~TRINITY_DN35229_c0_g1_i2.p1  ORF type:complete len:335 (-),score=20.59 TRINITY_DN35229_c0_g1_i2:1040-1960(-)